MLDMVGPLLKNSTGYHFILVIVDYATWYLDAVPLRAATALYIVKELLNGYPG